MKNKRKGTRLKMTEKQARYMIQWKMYIPVTARMENVHPGNLQKKYTAKWQRIYPKKI